MQHLKRKTKTRSSERSTQRSANSHSTRRVCSKEHKHKRDAYANRRYSARVWDEMFVQAIRYDLDRNTRDYIV